MKTILTVSDFIESAVENLIKCSMILPYELSRIESCKYELPEYNTNDGYECDGDTTLREYIQAYFSENGIKLSEYDFVNTLTTSDISSSLIGKKVNCVFTGLKTSGIITHLFEDKYTKGVEISFDTPVNWGGELYTKYTSTARKSDGWGNLNHVELIQ